MIMDTTLQFCNGEAVQGTAATRLEGDVVFLGSVAHDPGAGEPLYLVLQVDTAFASAGAATIQFQLASDAQEAIAADGGATVHWASQVYAYADLVAGWQIVIPLPQGMDYEAYLGLLVVTAGATTTAGAISAFLTLDPPVFRTYPEGNN